MRIQTRILASTSATLGLAMMGSAWLSTGQIQDTALAEAKNRAEAVVGAAQSARDYVADMHRNGTIDLKALLASAREELQRTKGSYRTTNAFKAIPIIAAIEAAKGAAKAAGLDLSVTAFQARNPENDPEKDQVAGAFRAQMLRDLAQHFVQGEVHETDWAAMGDESIIEELVAIRGIGRWTAEMFLIFHLMRPNVLPLDDLGLLKGISLSYFSGEPVSRAEAREVGDAWAPYRSVATWYLWRSLDPLPVDY